MELNKKNEELQSRREFFKKAARSALPILGAIALATTPQLGQAAEAMRCDCTAMCTNTCNVSCLHYCRSGCGATCKGVNK